MLPFFEYAKGLSYRNILIVVCSLIISIANIIPCAGHLQHYSKELRHHPLFISYIQRSLSLCITNICQFSSNFAVLLGSLKTRRLLKPTTPCFRNHVQNLGKRSIETGSTSKSTVPTPSRCLGLPYIGLNRALVSNIILDLWKLFFNFTSKLHKINGFSV